LPPTARGAVGGTPDVTCTGAGDGARGIQNNALFSVYAVARPDKTINSAFEYDPYAHPTLSGRAWITGLAQYTLDPTDPFPSGFTVGDTWGAGQ
jgi:hypothetical protein